MRVIICSMALLASLTSGAAAATRAYVMNGLFVGHGLAVVAAALRQRGYIVAYGSYERNRQFAADACAHPNDRIVVIGHSFGAERAAEVATQAAACGARDVTMVGVDPSQSVAVASSVHAINFVGELGGTVAGAQNIPVPGYTHMGIMDSPQVQQWVLQAAEQGESR